MSSPRRCAVFLDRDGVLIESTVRDGIPRPPDAVDDVVVLPGVVDACRRLRNANYLNIIVTNQPDVARAKTSLDTVHSINALLRRILPIDDIYVCPHDDADRCPCRKPAPGMLFNAAAEHDINLEQSFMVGDRWRDIEAGREAGCRTVLVDRGYSDHPVPAAHTMVADLAHGVDWILAFRNGVVVDDRRELA